ncbi:putative oxidoreductase [Jannaschia seosinensis]|uniref:Putative oxidoreductase n=1 Tax=Jannaschia seosinensis TaxID=313367 RepID=A0A0M7B7T5_9RHOB|nr:SDR family oxidoreductase [Jannaschia seosinensis]CUH38769.1 putative oxidoreductase [Jannaschia seosinensis]
MTRKTMFITGASSGIGAATARAAVKAGWNVGLFARSEETLARLADELGEAALALPGDVTIFEQQKDALARLSDRFGGVDAAFANAGTGLDAPGTENGDPEEWEQLLRINILGVLHTAKAALPHLKLCKGHMLMTGSAAGRRTIAGSVYGASKWFVHGYGGNLGEEMNEWGGRCTVIAPGMVNTAFFDAEKPDKIQPDDIADAVLYAVSTSDKASVREVFIMPRG